MMQAKTFRKNQDKWATTHQQQRSRVNREWYISQTLEDQGRMHALIENNDSCNGGLVFYDNTEALISDGDSQVPLSPEI